VAGGACQSKREMMDQTSSWSLPSIHMHIIRRKKEDYEFIVASFIKHVKVFHPS